MAKEIDEIFSHIDNGNNFLLNGGAGSGKTYSLIQVIKKIYNREPSADVACITFTNLAVEEIKERAPFDRLQVSTIHDFLWKNIGSFKNDIKRAIVELIESEEIYYSGDEDIDLEYYNDIDIRYREWKQLSKGIISHDEVIAIAEYLFNNNKLLADITKDKYDYILVDEYQDTFEKVIQILLEHLSKSEKTNLVGFFGDSMQSIYRRVGDIDRYIEEGKVELVTKSGNRRNPQIIVDLINKLRTDDLIQEVVGEQDATNYGVNGNLYFLYSQSDSYDIDEIRSLDYFEEFDFEDSDETKELYLVHNLIADKAGFPELMAIYDKDRILEYKKRIKDHLEEHGIDVGENVEFGEVIERGYKNPTKKMQKFIDSHSDLYEEAKSYLWKNIKDIYVKKDHLLGELNSSKELGNRNTQQDALINHLFQILECIQLYNASKYNDFIKKTHYTIQSVNDKTELKEAIDSLNNMKTESIGDVIDYADDKGIWKKDDRLNEFIREKEYIFDQVKEVTFEQVINLYNYVEEKTPYSTQHNIKGAEYDSVFVVLVNDRWNYYNFEYLFEGEGTESVLDRTRKLFYVCCSRAKKNLVVYFQQPSDKALETANEWFGSENVIEIEI